MNESERQWSLVFGLSKGFSFHRFFSSHRLRLAFVWERLSRKTAQIEVRKSRNLLSHLANLAIVDDDSLLSGNHPNHV